MRAHGPPGVSLCSDAESRRFGVLGAGAGGKLAFGGASFERAIFWGSIFRWCFVQDIAMEFGVKCENKMGVCKEMRFGSLSY